MIIVLFILLIIGSLRIVKKDIAVLYIEYLCIAKDKFSSSFGGLCLRIYYCLIAGLPNFFCIWLSSCFEQFRMGISQVTLRHSTRIINIKSSKIFCCFFIYNSPYLLSKLGIFRFEFWEATLEGGIHLKESKLLKISSL